MYKSSRVCKELEYCSGQTRDISKLRFISQNSYNAASMRGLIGVICPMNPPIGFDMEQRSNLAEVGFGGI